MPSQKPPKKRDEKTSPYSTQNSSTSTPGFSRGNRVGTSTGVGRAANRPDSFGPDTALKGARDTRGVTTTALPVKRLAGKAGIGPGRITKSGIAKTGEPRQGGQASRKEERFSPKVGRREALGEERANLPVPYAMVSRRASESLRRDHLWVYASDVERVELGSGEVPGLIPLVDNRGIPLGTALYSAASQIALRVVSREVITQAQWLKLLAERMRTAIARRAGLLEPETNACRLVFSEADDLPGIIVDKYAGVVVLQLLAKGLDNAETRAVCARCCGRSWVRLFGKELRFGSGLIRGFASWRGCRRQ